MYLYRVHCSLRATICVVAVLCLAPAGIITMQPQASAQAPGPTFFTVATGVVTSGPATPDWYAARLSLQPVETMSDPAAGSAGFLLSMVGTIAVTDGQSNELTVMQPGSALFVSPAARLSMSAPAGAATIWRIAVVSGGDPSPLVEGPGVERPISAIGEAGSPAPPQAVRTVDLRFGELDLGETASLGADGWAVPLVGALTGEGLLDNGSLVTAGRLVAPSTTGQAVQVGAADGPAVIGYIAMGPAVDPASLGMPASPDPAGAVGTGSDRDQPPDSPPVAGAPGTPTMVTANPTEVPLDTSDADGDGLTASDEAALGTNPSNPDTDEDGLRDGNEVNDYETNPLALDTDGDGVTDNDEVMGQYGNLSPTLADTDYDGLSDGDELFVHLTNPILNDTDNDGESDGAEIAANRDPLVLNDRDGDLLGDGLEAYYGTNPENPDSDEDILTDTFELFTTFTDPNRFDSDGDGTGDAVENASGTDPLDPASHP
jgi:hypothetical protein